MPQYVDSDGNVFEIPTPPAPDEDVSGKIVDKNNNEVISWLNDKAYSAGEVIGKTWRDDPTMILLIAFEFGGGVCVPLSFAASIVIDEIKDPSQSINEFLVNFGATLFFAAIGSIPVFGIPIGFVQKRIQQNIADHKLPGTVSWLAGGKQTTEQQQFFYAVENYPGVVGKSTAASFGDGMDYDPASKPIVCVERYENGRIGLGIFKDKRLEDKCYRLHEGVNLNNSPFNGDVNNLPTLPSAYKWVNVTGDTYQLQIIIYDAFENRVNEYGRPCYENGQVIPDIWAGAGFSDPNSFIPPTTKPPNGYTWQLFLAEANPINKAYYWRLQAIKYDQEEENKNWTSLTLEEKKDFYDKSGIPYPDQWLTPEELAAKYDNEYSDFYTNYNEYSKFYSSNMTNVYSSFYNNNSTNVYSNFYNQQKLNGSNRSQKLNGSNRSSQKLDGSNRSSTISSESTMNQLNFFRNVCANNDLCTSCPTTTTSTTTTSTTSTTPTSTTPTSTTTTSTTPTTPSTTTTSTPTSNINGELKSQDFTSKTLKEMFPEKSSTCPVCPVCPKTICFDISSGNPVPLPTPLPGDERKTLIDMFPYPSPDPPGSGYINDKYPSPPDIIVQQPPLNPSPPDDPPDIVPIPPPLPLPRDECPTFHPSATIPGKPSQVDIVNSITKYINDKGYRHDPDGIPWIPRSSWVPWDGVTTINPCTSTKTQIMNFIFPKPGGINTMRGLRERFYEVNPYKDNANPTVAEIENWNIEVIRHFRKLLGFNETTHPVSNHKCTYLKAAWAEERARTNYWSTKYPGTLDSASGPCTLPFSSNEHCGGSFLPDATDQQPYLCPSTMSPCTATSGAEGVSNHNTDIPWSIKLSRVIGMYLNSDGIGSHTGPFIGREYFGSSWYMNGGSLVVRTKWSGKLNPTCP